MAVNERGGAFSGGPSTDADIVRDGPIDESTAGGTADATPGGAFGSGISQSAEQGVILNAVEVSADLAEVRRLLALAVLAEAGAQAAQAAAEAAETEAEAAEAQAIIDAAAAAASAALAMAQVALAEAQALLAAGSARDAEADAVESDTWSQVARSWNDGTAPTGNLVLIGNPDTGTSTDNAEFWNGQAQGAATTAEIAEASAVQARIAAVAARDLAVAARVAAVAANVLAQQAVVDAEQARDDARIAETGAEMAEMNAETAQAAAEVIQANLEQITVTSTGGDVLGESTTVTLRNADLSIFGQSFTVQAGAQGAPGADGALGSFVDISGQDPIFNPVITDTVAAATALRLLAGAAPISTIGITQAQADAIIANTAKRSYPLSEQSQLATNTMAITLQDARIGDNETDITTNTQNIGTNAGAIQTVQTQASNNAIATSNLTGRVTSIEAVDVQQAQSIADNVQDIATNTNGIMLANNRITVNAGAITALDTDLSSLSGRVDANEGDIDTLQTFDTAQSLLNTGLRTDVDANEAAITTKQDTIPQVVITRAGDDTANFSANGDLNLLLADATGVIPNPAVDPDATDLVRISIGGDTFDLATGEVVIGNNDDEILTSVEVLDSIMIGTREFRLRGAPIFTPPVAASRFDIDIFYDEDLFPGARTTIEKPVFDRDDGTLHQFRIEPRIVGLNGTQITNPTFNFVNTSYGMFARIGTSQQFGMNLTTAQVNQFNTYDFDSQGSWTETNGDDVNVVVDRDQAVQYFSVRDWYTFSGTALPTALSQFTSQGSFTRGDDFTFSGGTEAYVLLPQTTFGTDDPVSTYTFKSGVLFLNNTVLLAGNSIAAGFSLYELNDYAGGGTLDVTIT